LNGGNAVKVCVAMALREQAAKIGIAMEVLNQEDGAMLIVGKFGSKDWAQTMGLCHLDKANGAIEPIGVGKGKSAEALRASSAA
jgi:hypothetical protein